jgi:hypothetical protein
MTRGAPLFCFALVSVVFATGWAHAQDSVVVVGGVVRNAGSRTVSLSLCYTRQHDGHCAATGKSGMSGIFILATKISGDVPKRFFVITEGPVTARPVAADLEGSSDGIFRVVTDDINTCDPTDSHLTMKEIADCATAVRETHQLKLALQVESKDEAAQTIRGFADTLARTTKFQTGSNLAELMTTLKQLKEPLDGDPRGPAFAWGHDPLLFPHGLDNHGTSCPPNPEVAAQGTSGYTNLGDRCEGYTVVNTAGAPEIVSLTDESFAIHAKEAEVILSWPRWGTGSVCLLATQTDVASGWRMRTKLDAGTDSFLWNLDRVHSAHVDPRSIGILAKGCDGRTYLPVRIGANNPTVGGYRLVLHAPHQLTKVYATVTEETADGTAHSGIRTPISFTQTTSPTISIPVTVQNPTTHFVTVKIEVYGVTEEDDWADARALSFRFQVRP